MNIREYKTQELLLIANNVTGEYSDKRVRQAKLELCRRGVEDDAIADITKEKEEAFVKRLDAAARAEQARKDKWNERNRHVSYLWWEMAVMLFFAPFYLMKDVRTIGAIILFLPCYLLSWTPIDFSELFSEFKRLKAEKYDLKFRQRLVLLGVGDVLWVVYAWCEIYVFR